MKPIGFTYDHAQAYQNSLVRGKSFTDTINYEVTLYRVKQDINRWRNAQLSAENIYYPNRTEYYRLCKDVVLDPHLTSCIEQRINAVLGREIVVTSLEGVVNDQKTNQFKKAWFRKLIRFILEKKYYGFSMVDLGPLDNETMTFPQIKLVPRQYVRPELNIVVPSTGSYTGIQINDAKFINWNPFFGERTELGLLIKIAPYVIWKKGALGYWSEYLEKFGMPIRVGRTNVQDEILKSNMENALRSMGAAFWGVMDRDDTFELIQSGIQGAWENYDKMVERVDSQISKIVLSQTGTTDEKAHVGSSNVHADIFANIIEADVQDLEDDLNETMRPLLTFHGFDIGDDLFNVRLKESTSLAEKALMVASFLPYVKMDKKWMEDTFDVVLSDEPEPDETKPQGGAGVGKQETNYLNITNEYNHTCTVCGGFENKKEVDPFTQDEESEFIENIYEGLITVYNLPISIYEKTANIILDGLKSGYGSVTSTDTLFAELTENVYVFSAAKTYQQVRDISVLLSKYPKRKDLFIKNAKVLFSEYNKNYLSAEIDNAHGSALQARKWTEIQRDKYVLKFLEYQTAGDARVRPTHAELDGITRKADDSFWDLYYPPNGWRCRCTTISHADVSEVTDLSKFTPPNDVPKLFQMNVGKDGYVFKPDHPYFDVAKGDKGWAKKNFGLPINGKE